MQKEMELSKDFESSQQSSTVERNEISLTQEESVYSDDSLGIIPPKPEIAPSK